MGYARTMEYLVEMLAATLLNSFSKRKSTQKLIYIPEGVDASEDVLRKYALKLFWKVPFKTCRTH
jgi:uncharacterized protein YwgA